MRENPKPYEIYKHFKGNLYQILTIAKDSEDGSLKVVYQALYGSYEVYVRDLSMFMSSVDRAKYPEVTQEYRYERVNVKQVNMDREELGEGVSVVGSAETESATLAIEADAAHTLDPMLLQFLDSDTYEEKLNILHMLQPRITQEMLSTMAAALDIEVADGSVEERYEQVKSCLLTFEKYECNRLR